MRRVVKASSDLRVGGISAEGCPLLVNDGMVEPLPSMWLIEVGGAPRYDTAWAYAYALACWLSWLELHKIDLWKVTLSDVKRFAQALASNRSNSTVNVHISAVCSFYGWAYTEGFSHILPFRLATKVWKRQDGLPKVGEIKFRKVKRTKPRAHTEAEFDAILANTPRKDRGLILRDELVAEFGYRAGLRSMEVAGLRVHDLEIAKRMSGFYTIDLVETKNLRPRTIVIAANYHQRLRNYVRVYRTPIVEKARERDPRYCDPGHLFLTVAGKPYGRRYISLAWREAAAAAAIPSKFHMNRHSFATRIIAACKAAGEPARHIARDLLGHADEATVADYDHTPLISEDVTQADWFARVLSGDV